MTTVRPLSLNEAIHLEPLTELALQRYSIEVEGTEVRMKGHHGEAIRDVQFVVDLVQYYSHPDPKHVDRFSGYGFSILLDYLKRTHRFYMDQLLPKIEMAVHNIQRTFPDHPIVSLLDHFYRNYQNELLEHIELEERHLFPYAVSLYDGKVQSDYSIATFESQHNHDIEDHLQSVIDLIEEGFPEVKRSFAYRAFRQLLENFRTDLTIHHLIEEQVFLQKVKSLEDDVISS